MRFLLIFLQVFPVFLIGQLLSLSSTSTPICHNTAHRVRLMSVWFDLRHLIAIRRLLALHDRNPKCSYTYRVQPLYIQQTATFERKTITNVSAPIIRNPSIVTRQFSPTGEFPLKNNRLNSHTVDFRHTTGRLSFIYAPMQKRGRPVKGFETLDVVVSFAEGEL